MSLTPEVLEALGPGIREVRRVGGGDINEGWQIVRDVGRATAVGHAPPAGQAVERVSFVKTRTDPGPGEYAAEAAGLDWLAAAGALQVPEVLGVGDRFLELEWIEHGRLDAAGLEELGRGLAAVHAAGAETFGGDGPIRIGRLELPNHRNDSWPAFFAECRLLPLRSAAGLSPRGVRGLERVCDRLVELAGPAEPPARVHGDLWSGNVLAGQDGRPWLIDPVAHGGHREVDLAMLALFGGVSPRVTSAYDEVAPLGGGWRDRVGLWQLFPLLVHAALFGGGYAASAEVILARYGGRG